MTAHALDRTGLKATESADKYTEYAAKYMDSVRF